MNRVAVARVVDICGRDAAVPAFEAESIELSGRGMHVRTPYLPPLGAPLVCRLEDAGREIVVEGVVAWQNEHKDGGEFGIQFTALDSGSVDALRGLCGLDPAVPAAPAAAPATPDPSAPPAPAGMPVKLHIDGLGAPMKARVRGGGSRRLQVGSNLEFLKVGRGLEVEDVEQGERRGARIDAVSIAIDPQTQVPQLVVALRYEGEDTTPEPSVIGAEDASGKGVAKGPAATASASGVGSSVSVAATSTDDDQDDGDLDDDEDDELSPDDSGDDEDAALQMRGRVDALAVQIGNAAKNTGEKLASASGSALRGFASWARSAKNKAADASARRGGAKRRSTAPAPQPVVSQARKLRPQNGAASADEPVGNKKRLVVVAASVTVVSLCVGAFALTGRSSKRAPEPVAASQVLSQTSPASQLPATQSPGALPAAIGAVPAVPGVPAAPNAAGGAARPGIVANVPLFGPTPMATLEPAPLGPSPDELAAAKAPATRAPEERMDDSDVDDDRGARDESFTDGKKDKGDKKDKSDDDKSDKDRAAEEKAAGVKPWGLGKLHMPVVHRLKLDRPGAAIDGKKEIAGFSVLIPGRKVESGASAIPKRDDRIADVRTKNGPDGARVTFVFRSKIPGYKVRLRKSYVEIFVSSPEGAK